MSDNARTALFVLAGLLILILACLVLFGAVLRRRGRSTGDDTRVERLVFEGGSSDDLDVEYAASPRSFGGGGAGLEVAQSDNMACPTCRREYDHGLGFCPYDARRLVAVHELHDPGRKDGSVCPSCRRSYDSGVRFCPHDASELIPVAVYTATARATDRKPTGVIARICPQCQRRYDLSASFCAKDGSELVVIN